MTRPSELLAAAQAAEDALPALYDAIRAELDAAGREARMR